MAQPLRDHEYDPDDEKPVVRPKPRVIEGGSEGDSKPAGNLKAASSQELDSAERSPLRGIEGGGEGDSKPSGNLSAVDDKEKNLAKGSTVQDRLGKGYTGKEAQGRSKKLRGYLNKKNTIIGLVTGGVVGGSIFGLSIIQGPMQLIHLSQILQKNFSSNEDNTATRTRGLVRYARTGDIGETRVGKLGSVTMAKVLGQLEDIGIEFQKNPYSGYPKSMTVDISKHPEFRGMSETKAKAAIAKKYNIPIGDLLRVGTGSDVRGHKFAVNTRDFNPRQARFMLSTSLKALENGKVTTALQVRVFNRYFNVPLFSPLKKLENKLATKTERKKAEKERAKERQERFKNSPTGTKATKAKEKLKGALDGNKAKLSGVLLATAGVCLVRSIADDVVTADREISAGAAIEAIDKTAAGAQAQSGDNIDAQAAGSVVAGFEDDNGKTIWAAKALQATSGENNPTGEDLPDDYKQAFSSDTTAANIRSFLDFPGADIACSPGGQIVQGAVGIGLLVIGPGGWAVNAAKGTAGAAASAGVIYLLQNRFVELLDNDSIVPIPPSGPLGGNVLAYGAREASNMTARANGGVELSSTESAALDRQMLLESQEEFQSRGFFARIFDTYDHRSLASHLIGTPETNPTRIASSLVSNLLNVGSFVSNFSSVFMPKTYAADTYDWGFNRYGIPREILEDQRFDDPYDNADKVAALLNSDAGDKYIKKAKTCFGVSISKGDSGWDAIAEEEINPNEEDYLDAKCNNLSDNNWKRIILFVFDTRLMESIACYDGDESACNDISAISGSTAEESNLSEGVECPANLNDTKKVGTTTYYRMPNAPNSEYTFDPGTPPAQRYGHKELICVIYTAAKKYKEKYGSSSTIKVGDLNASGHASHKWGVAVDLNAKGSKAAADGTDGAYDKQATIDFGKMLVATGQVKNIWWCSPGSSVGDTARGGDGSLKAISDYADSIGKPATIHCVDPNHFNHFHLDVDAPRGDVDMP